jgi:AAA domain
MPTSTRWTAPAASPVAGPLPSQRELNTSHRGVLTDRPEVAYDLVLVGGVPGAGKTTAIARATDDLENVRAIDPEHLTWWLRQRLPERVPYRAYRWLVHLLHTLRVLIHLLDGPREGRQLVVHDPGTRRRRRSLLLRLAHLAGWRTVLLYVDVDRAAARSGQLQRGRVVRSFDEHWESWQHLRPALDAAAHDQAVADPVLLAERADAAEVLRRLCRSAGATPQRTP